MHYDVEDLSDNELAKVHVRHLAGGRSQAITSTPTSSHREYVYRFEFPEAPGALHKFLTALNFTNQGWSISLFHYRNHGDDFGRVLVGILLEKKDLEAFHLFLSNLGYSYYDESNNKAYFQFLQ